MTSLITILPLSLSVLGVSNSSSDLSYEATVEQATPRFALIENTIDPTDNVAPAETKPVDTKPVDGKGKGNFPHDGATPLPRPGVPEPVLGDIDFDSVLTPADMLALIAAWGPCPELIDVSCPADINGDQNVDAQDLSSFIRLWNQAQAEDNS